MNHVYLYQMIYIGTCKNICCYVYKKMRLNSFNFRIKVLSWLIWFDWGFYFQKLYSYIRVSQKFGIKVYWRLQFFEY